MANDVSGNDPQNEAVEFEETVNADDEVEEEEIFSTDQVGKGIREEGEKLSEEFSSENVSTSIDYSPYLEDISNGVKFNGLILLGLVLLLGLLMGLKKL